MSQRCFAILVPACLFLLVFGFKLDVVHRYGSDLPRWDALDAEGLALYAPLAEGRLRFADLLRPHNEHRIFWTKLLGLAELRLNGQWDARLQCTVNAALHSLIAVAVFLFARQNLGRTWHAPAFALVALLFGLPLAWENPVAGFHSQQYFLLGFSFGAIALLPAAPPWSARWWTGAACTLAALGTMGSGLFAAAIVLLVLALLGWREGNLAGPFRHAAPTVAVCALALALGVLGHVSVSYHETLKAGSAGDFLRYALHCLQWPAQDWSWLALPLWLPTTLLAWRTWRRQDRAAGSFPLVLLGLAAWVLLQVLATAYTRGAGGGMPSARYADTLAFGLLVNGLALAWLWPRLAPAVTRSGLGVAWILAAAVPATLQADRIFREILPANRRHLEACEENVRRYLATDDASHLDTPDIPYPGIRALRERIDLPAIRAILPVSVRAPVPLAGSDPAGQLISYSTVRHARTYAPPSPAPALVAALPKLAQRTFWVASSGCTDFSLSLSKPAVLRLLVAGTGQPELSLALPSFTAPIRLPSLSPTIWRAVYVPVSSPNPVLRAGTPAGSWLAITEPVEMARGSYWCWRLVRSGRFLWPAAAGLALLVGLGAWYCARREKALG
ncbi:MAG: hypothetical protein ACOZE5_12415 [Verrucomicrobiota bacterium]